MSSTTTEGRDRLGAATRLVMLGGIVVACVVWGIPGVQFGPRLFELLVMGGVAVPLLVVVVLTLLRRSTLDLWIVPLVGLLLVLCVPWVAFIGLPCIVTLQYMVLSALRGSHHDLRAGALLVLLLLVPGTGLALNMGDAGSTVSYLAVAAGVVVFAWRSHTRYDRAGATTAQTAV